MILQKKEDNTLQTMLEKSNIKELIEFERFCRDNSLWDEMRKCFAADSLVRISWFEGTGSQFVDASSKMKERAPHKIYNTQIWLNGDRAVAVMAATIQSRLENDGLPYELNSDAKLVFRVQKERGMWLIAALEGIYEKDSILPVYPHGGVIAMSELAGYRSSYAGLSYTLSRNGYAINQELPGIDRPDLTKRFYQEADEWLRAGRIDAEQTAGMEGK